MRSPQFSYLIKSHLNNCFTNIPQHFLLIYDLHLESTYSSFINLFPNKIGLPAGELTKDLTSLIPLADSINSFKLTQNPHFVAFGGGSICDLTGFIASIWKRGCSLSLIPSTWLSVIDSSHGGKNAVNVRGVKNQVGTFYFPDQIFIVTELLKDQPFERLSEAWSEIVKVALIDSQELFTKILEPNYDPIANIKDIIAAKVKIVEQDPFEQLGIRRVLNLGHTLGHIIEAQLSMNHGLAIGYGLRFSIEWSRYRNYLIQDLEIPGIPSLNELQNIIQNLNDPEMLLRQDKKNDSLGLNFVFIREPGKVFTESVGISEFISYFNKLRCKT